MTFKTAPAAADLYTRNQAPLFDQQALGPVPVGFQAFYGRPGSQTIFSPDADVVSMDILRGNRKTAKLSPRNEIMRLLGPNQQSVNRGKSTNVARIFPLSIEQSDISAGMQRERIPNEPMENSGYTSARRLRYWSMKEHFEQVRRTIMMNERLAAQSILEGIQDGVMDTTNSLEQYDFYRNSDNSVTLGTQWTDVTNATPIGDLDDAGRIYQVNSFRRAEFCVFSSDTLEAYLKTDEIRNYADNRRYEMVQVSTTNPVPPKFNFMVEAGFTPWGLVKTYRGLTLWIFTYDAMWETDADVVTDYMPAGKVVMGSTQARADRMFGPSETFDEVPARDRFYQEMFGFSPGAAPMPPNIVVPGVIDSRMFYFDAYPNQNWSSITTRTQCAPIFVPTETDAWLVIENAA